MSLEHLLKRKIIFVEKKRKSNFYDHTINMKGNFPMNNLTNIKNIGKCVWIICFYALCCFLTSRFGTWSFLLTHLLLSWKPQEDCRHFNETQRREWLLVGVREADNFSPTIAYSFLLQFHIRRWSGHKKKVKKVNNKCLVYHSFFKSFTLACSRSNSQVYEGGEALHQGHLGALKVTEGERCIKDIFEEKRIKL